MDNTKQPELDCRQETLLGFAQGVRERGKVFFYVRIPEDVQAVGPGERYENPLQDALDAADLGEVTGGGSERSEGKSITFCGLDVEVRDRDRALALIISVLRGLNAPLGTTIEEFLPIYQKHPL
jgi:hypothetical protein